MSESKVDKDLTELYESDETKGENYWSRKFRSSYYTVRKALVLLNKAKRNTYKGGSKGLKGELVTKAQITNKEACEKLREVLEKAVAELEN